MQTWLLPLLLPLLTSKRRPARRLSTRPQGMNRRAFLQAGAAVLGAALAVGAFKRPMYAQTFDAPLRPAIAPHENADRWLFRFDANGVTIFSYMPGARVDDALRRGWNIAPAEVADARVRHCIREMIGGGVDVEGVAAKCAVKFARIDVQQYEP